MGNGYFSVDSILKNNTFVFEIINYLYKFLRNPYRPIKIVTE